MENGMSEKKDETKKGGKRNMALIMGLVMIVVVIMTIFQMKDGGANGCQVVPSSAFGQAQTQTWVELDNAVQAKLTSGIELNFPEVSDMGEEHWYVYTHQVTEVRWFDGETENMRISKGKNCGQPLYKDTVQAVSTVIADVDGKSVTEYGDGKTIQAMSWTEGEYSYYAAFWKQPLSKAEAEAFVSATE
jgi:hypothetical protein